MSKISYKELTDSELLSLMYTHHATLKSSIRKLKELKKEAK